MSRRGDSTPRALMTRICGSCSSMAAPWVATLNVSTTPPLYAILFHATSGDGPYVPCGTVAPTSESTLR